MSAKPEQMIVVPMPYALVPIQLAVTIAHVILVLLMYSAMVLNVT